MHPRAALAFASAPGALFAHYRRASTPLTRLPRHRRSLAAPKSRATMPSDVKVSDLRVADVKVSALRENYTQPGLSDASAASAASTSPIDLFQTWLSDAVAAAEPEPNAMCLCTVGADSRPAARYVLLKAVDRRGFVWYTNYGSRKARELAGNPAAALTFWWAGSERSVRVEGDVAKVGGDESDAYFASRPPMSRLGAWASEQSEEVDGREVLEERWAKLMEEYMPGGKGSEPVKVIERPEGWGGFRLVPTRIEFWKGRASRLHDRVVFERDSGDEDRWRQKRLQP